MTTRRGSDFDLRRAILDPGFTPREGDAAPLLDLLTASGDASAAAERALLRLGVWAVPPAVAHLETAGAAARAAVLRFLGRVGAETASPAAAAALVARLGDEDARARRAAATALGKARPEGAGEALAAALARETDASARRAMIEALGKAGGEGAIDALAKAKGEGPAEEQARARAALIVTRTVARQTPSAIDATRAAEKPVRVAIRCRAGLEAILEGELPAALGAKLRRDLPAGARIEATLRGAPMELFAARTMLSFGFPLPVGKLSDDDPTPAIVEALVSPEAQAILRRWTTGPLRFRLAWAQGGKRRASVWRAAEEVAARVPDLINDPTDSPWEAVVFEGGGLVRVELAPRIADPRFAYRLGDVPAASHPTIAAALARAGGVRPDDVVWDPFAGSGTELCERALAGGYRLLVGSDLEASALEVARRNLEAAGVRDALLLQGDACSLRPPQAPTLIVTNPPLGRRVQRSAALGPMLERFVVHAARTLAPGGRLVWISPFPERTRALALSSGLSAGLAREVDMGGFTAVMQVFVRDAPPKRARGDQ